MHGVTAIDKTTELKSHTLERGHVGGLYVAVPVVGWGVAGVSVLANPVLFLQRIE